MRILHVTSHLNVGGVTSYLLSLSRGLSRRGHTVTIASDDGQLAEYLQADGITHWQLPLHSSAEFSLQVWRAGRVLADRVRRKPVDVIHAHTRVAQVLAHRLSQRFRIPYVTTWHGFFRMNLGRRLWPCTGDVTIAISEPVREHLLRTFHLPPTRICLISHGVDVASFASVTPGEQRQLRAQLGIPPQVPVIGTVARLVASKAVGHLVRSFVRLRRMMPTAHLLIVGDGAERASLERLAGESGVAPAVHLAGALPDTRVALSLMDAFVFLPAEQEGFGLSLLEAMASGRPIVALRRGGGATWVLEQSQVGVLVEPGDEETLANTVLRILQDVPLTRRLAEEAKAIAIEHYNLSRVLDQVEGVYREALALRKT
jgi:glycosyltransferase involved in cell wall biosynthesis